MEDHHLHQDQWEKVLAVLNGDLPVAIDLTAEERSLLDELNDIKEASKIYQDSKFDSHTKIQAVKQRLHFSETEEQQVISLWPRIVAVVAAVAFVVLCLYFFNAPRHPELVSGSQTVQNDIAPGQVGATLTLASGKKIRLSDAANGELAKEGGISINKTADGKLVYKVVDHNGALSAKINTLSTANGETYQVNLPDGTLVWLNAESSVSYPASFTGLKQRAIQLTGEAYLEVAKDKQHPFIVKTGRQEIQVLGTHFNVYAYAGEPVKTALAEGSVKVTAGGQFKIIAPGQQTVVKGNAIAVEEVDLEEKLAWKDGTFRFNSEPISSIMTQLSRWYDIDVVFDGELKNDAFTGKISKFKNISQVLRMLEKTKDVHFKVEGRRVTVRQ